MKYWNTLEIKPTSNLAEIKKAYARKLKIHHPEDDPEGFQKLRMAYEATLNEAKYMDVLDFDEKEIISDEHAMTTSIFEEKSEGKEEILSIVKDELSLQHTVDKNKISEELISNFMDRFKKICASDVLRNDQEQWQKLLDDEDYWNLDIRQELNFSVLNFLQENYKLPICRLPSATWEILDKYFFWLDQERNLYLFFQEDFWDFLMEKIRYNRENYLQYFIRKANDFWKFIKNGSMRLFVIKGVRIILVILVSFSFLILAVKAPKIFYTLLLGFIVYKIYCKFIR